jgi:hypothetical protein
VYEKERERERLRAKCVYERERERAAEKGVTFIFENIAHSFYSSFIASVLTSSNIQRARRETLKKPDVGNYEKRYF